MAKKKLPKELVALQMKYSEAAKKETGPRRATDPSDYGFRRKERELTRYNPEPWPEPFAKVKIKPLTPEMLRRKYGPKRMQVTAKTSGRSENRDYDPVKTFVRKRANGKEKSRLDYYKEAKMEPAGKLPMTSRRAWRLERHPPDEDLVGAAMKFVGGKRAVHEHPNVYAAVRTGLEMIPGVRHMTREGALNERPGKVAKKVGTEAAAAVGYQMAGGMAGELAGKFGPAIAKAGKKAVGKQLSGALAKFERYKKSMTLTEKGARKKMAKMSAKTVKDESAKLKLNQKRLERHRSMQMLKGHEEKIRGIESGRPVNIEKIPRRAEIEKVRDRVAGYWREKTTAGKPGGKLPARNPKRQELLDSMSVQDQVNYAKKFGHHPNQGKYYDILEHMRRKYNPELYKKSTRKLASAAGG